MCPVIDNPTSCKIRTVVLFLHAKNLTVVGICCELRLAVYGQNVMNEGSVRQWCRMFKYGWTDVHDEEQSRKPFIVSE
jgi:hypothetical protein